MNNFITSFIITFIAGISTILGGFVVLFNIKNKDKIILTSLSFAAGIMVCISIIELLPESYNYLIREYSFIYLLIIMAISIFSGFLLFKLLDILLTKDVDNLYRVGIFSMLAIIIHNIPEGIITFILSSSNIRLGLFMGLSIALHNIPEGISIMVPVYYGSGSYKKAFLFTLIAGVSEVVGGVVFYLIFNNYVNDLFLGSIFSFVAGIMIYLSFFELLPKSLEYENRNLTLSSFMIGIIFFFLISIFMH